MELALIIFVGVMALLLVGCIGMLIRNQFVYTARRRLIDQIHEAAGTDLATGHDWQWRYDYYETVSYNKMALHFWKRPTKMYGNLDFINPNIKREN